MKDEHNSLNIQRQPGPLVAPLGGRVEQYYALDGAVPVSGSLGSGTASLWAEQLSTNATRVDVLLRYGKSNGWLDDQPAMITRRVGHGSITYLGAVLDPDLMRKVWRGPQPKHASKPNSLPYPPALKFAAAWTPAKRYLYSSITAPPHCRSRCPPP